MEPLRTEPVSLAKALSVKNRLAGRLSQARSNIETYNSVLAGQRDDEGRATVDVRAEYERLPDAPGGPGRRQGGHPAGQRRRSTRTCCGWARRRPWSRCSTA